MNKYQKQRSKEIKQLLKCDNLGLTTYSAARRYWNRLYIPTWLSPCDYCCNDCCKHKTKSPISYCPDLITIDDKLNRALRLLPQGVKMINN